jgi:hypothetical protein
MMTSDTRYAPVRDTFYVAVYMPDGTGEHYDHLNAQDAKRLADAATANGASVDFGAESE